MKKKFRVGQHKKGERVWVTGTVGEGISGQWLLKMVTEASHGIRKALSHSYLFEVWHLPKFP